MTVQRFVLVATTGDRWEMMRAFLASVKAFLPDWRLVVVGQCLTKAQEAEIVQTVPAVTLASVPDRLGMHGARLRGLAEIDWLTDGPYVVCSCDDDMEFIAETNLEPCVRAVMRPGFGLVSAGWVKHPSLVAKAVEAKIDAFVKQPIVYTGGGLLFSREVAGIIRSIPDKPWLCDNSMWSLAVYLSGRENYRFRGSITVHRILSKGGRKTWVDAGKRLLPDERYVNLRPSKIGGENAFHIPMSSDLTSLAKNKHAFARLRLLRGGSQ